MARPNLEERDWYFTIEIARMEQVSRVTVLKMMERGHFPNAYRSDPLVPNSPIRIPKSDYEEFLKAQRGVRSRKDKKRRGGTTK